MKNASKWLIIGLLMTSFSGHISGQDARTKALYIFSFARYINWPAEYQQGDFVIGVIGDCPIIPELEKITSGRQIGSQKVVIRKFTESAPPSACHILYIPEKCCEHFPKISKSMEKHATLIVTDKEGLVKSGSGISFFINDQNKLGFQMNKQSIKEKGLGVDNKLDMLAEASQ